MKLRFPLHPMEANTSPAIPTGSQFWYEPKWDGFRCIVFKKNGKVELQSKALKKLTRYFPEVVALVENIKADNFIIDSEIVIPIGTSLSFDNLLQRIHPAASRIAKLSKETPASLVVFDILSEDKIGDITGHPLFERRKILEKFAARNFTSKKKNGAHLYLSPMAKTMKDAKKWLISSGVSLDGLMIKDREQPYLFGDRSGMTKIKFKKTADCVVGGYRMGSKGGKVGSLLLGLYNEEGLLDHIGFVTASQFPDKNALTKQLKGLTQPPGFTGAAPGGPSRWSTERSAQWKPLKTTLVIEVEFDHFTGGRFRHGTKFLRWRPDKKPKQCTTKQVVRDEGSALLLLRKP